MSVELLIIQNGRGDAFAVLRKKLEDGSRDSIDKDRPLSIYGLTE